MALFGITDGLARSVEGVQARVSEYLFEPVVRLGVTGLSRAGKTVFITGLISNLLARGRMPQLTAEREGRIDAVYLQPQPDVTLPRFDYEAHMQSLLADRPVWPESTRSISELRLSFRVRHGGWRSVLRGTSVVHLDIVDYPGEWLLDLALMEKDYATWAQDALQRMKERPEGAQVLKLIGQTDGAAALEEPQAQTLARVFTDYLQASRASGHSDCTPGRFLLPGDLAGSPVLTFAPLRPSDTPRGSLAREMERRYEAYKDHVVAPFFREHFARLDRQVVLMDVLGAIHHGPRALEDMRRMMAEILGAFRVGRTGWLSTILGAKRIEKILFAATKADHLHHEQHPQLTAIAEAMVAEAKSRAEFAGAEVAAMSLAGLRATVEEVVERDGHRLPAVKGRLLATGKPAVMFPGALPSDPARVLSPARAGATEWLGAEYGLMCFAPARLALRPGEGPPHIRMDRAVEFLIGDRL